MNITKVRKLLRDNLSCDVFWDAQTLKYYSVDSSSYQVFPKIVVIPNSIRDIKKTLKIARSYKIPIVPRGAASGLVGSALGSGIIIDMKNFDSLSISKGYAYVGAGISKGKLDSELKGNNMFFPPNPSVGPYCSIGGMIANNASGSHSLKYGSTIDNVTEIKFLTIQGKMITLSKDKKLANKIYKIAREAELDKFPKVSKNSSGYRLDKVTSPKEAHKVLIGSEGTLGVFISAKLSIRKIPTKKKLFILSYSDIKNAFEDCKLFLHPGPSAIEFVDKYTSDKFPYQFTNKDTKCVLFVEFDEKIIKCSKFLKENNHGNIELELQNKADIEKWWKYRDSALFYSIKTIKKSQKTPHVIEDAVVPVNKLGTLFSIIDHINTKFQTKSIIYGHLGNGNLHVRLVASRMKKELLEKIASTYFSQIIVHGGSISGEHGDGLARSEFVRKQYGDKNYQIFKRLKSLFDDQNLLNPSKIITVKSTVVKNLKMPS